ncbi:MAG: hypothetical protein J1F41_06280 [Lachnospiraceae bacterium]|nr:hypothetical protein [Lachnospiraceae bacterium]
MGMTDKQFNGFIRLILDTINDVIENMADGKEKDKLQNLANNLQQILED